LHLTGNEYSFHFVLEPLAKNLHFMWNNNGTITTFQWAGETEVWCFCCLATEIGTDENGRDHLIGVKVWKLEYRLLAENTSYIIVYIVSLRQLNSKWKFKFELFN